MLCENSRSVKAVVVIAKGGREVWKCMVVNKAQQEHLLNVAWLSEVAQIWTLTRLPEWGLYTPRWEKLGKARNHVLLGSICDCYLRFRPALAVLSTSSSRRVL